MSRSWIRCLSAGRPLADPTQVLKGALYVLKDPEKAIFWARKSADQGLPAGQFALGTAYGRGEGVAQDYVQAYKWVSLAAAQGHEGAKDSQSTLESILTPEQLAEGKKQAAEFRPVVVDVK